jgi:hypothetical protein
MMRLRNSSIVLLVFTGVILATSCSSNAPSPFNGELAATSAMQTLTAMGIFTTPDSIQPIVSRTPQPTDAEGMPTASLTRTPSLRTPTPTEDQEPCTDVANYGGDIDITYPDGTEVFPGASIEKIWRIRNGGTCTWNPEYKLVFDHGDQMSGPSLHTLQVSVDPNDSVDLSMDLIVPTTPGTYQGFWKLRNGQGDYVLGPTGTDLRLWVKVVVPETEPGVNKVIFNLVASYSGQVQSDSSTSTLTNVGDTPGGASVQAFMTWDISSIPAGSTIDEVEVNFSDFNTFGSPFTDLNCLRAYAQNYGTLDATDYVSGAVTGALEAWCSLNELRFPEISNGFKTSLQAKVGSPRFQIRLQFNEVASDGDAAADVVRFAQAQLYVTYSEP